MKNNLEKKKDESISNLKKVLYSFHKKYDKSKEGEQPDSIILSEDEDVGYISTGIFGLNKILSGSYFQGIKENSTIQLAGASNVGKSLFCGCIIREAQKIGYLTFIYTSEQGATSNKYYKNIGCDTELIRRTAVITIENFRNTVIKDIEIFKKENPEVKLLIILDSFGNLRSSKELADIEKGKDAGDMGTRAKAANSMMASVTSFFNKYGIPFIFINHVYDNPASLYAGRAILAGGKKVYYVSNQILYLTASSLIASEDNLSELDTVAVTGIKITALTLKNREIPEHQKAVIKLNYKKGFDPYCGLVDDAVRLGMIEIKGPMCYLYDENGKEIKKVKGKKNLETPEIFTDEFIKKMDEKIQAENNYSILDEMEIRELVKKPIEDDAEEEEENV